MWNISLSGFLLFPVFGGFSCFLSLAISPVSCVFWFLLFPVFGVFSCFLCFWISPFSCVWGFLLFPVFWGFLLFPVLGVSPVSCVLGVYPFSCVWGTHNGVIFFAKWTAQLTCENVRQMSKVTSFAIFPLMTSNLPEWNTFKINSRKVIEEVMLLLLRQSTVSVPIGFISEAKDDQVERMSCDEKGMLQIFTLW